MTEPRPTSTDPAASGTATASASHTPGPYKPQAPWVSTVGYFIFFSRWLQAPLYLGLIVAQLIYVVVFMTELWHLGEQVIGSFLFPGDEHYEFTEATVMLAVLGLIDVVMIANLLIMVIIGGYETFVSRIRVDGHPDQPEWLSHVNANVLKVKLAMAIIGISSIHLLKTFIEVGDLGAKNTHSVTNETYTWDGVFWQVMIHITFILSAVALAWIDRMSLKHAVHAKNAEAPLEPQLAAH
ncbi:MAG: TIGR00645 family protein [Protaetiibacter sp.]